MTCGIYVIEHVASGRCYVGSSSNVNVRWSQHRYCLTRITHMNKKLQNAWTKYGADAFEFRLITTCSEGDLLEQETAWIGKLDSVRSGFNISAIAGRGRAGIKHSAESIARMSESRKGRAVSVETRKKLSEAFSGRQFSEETRRRISEAKTGKKRAPFSAQALANMSAAKKGIVHSAETRAKLSAAHKGKRMSDAARKNMSIAQRKRFGSP